MLDILVDFLPLIGSVMAGIIVFVQATDREKQHSLDILEPSRFSHAPTIDHHRSLFTLTL